MWFSINRLFQWHRLFQAAVSCLTHKSLRLYAAIFGKNETLSMSQWRCPLTMTLASSSLLKKSVLKRLQRVSRNKPSPYLNAKKPAVSPASVCHFKFCNFVCLWLRLARNKSRQGRWFLMKFGVFLKLAQGPINESKFVASELYMATDWDLFAKFSALNRAMMNWQI